MLTHDNMDRLQLLPGCPERLRIPGGNAADFFESNHPLKCYYNQAFSKIANMREWWNWQTR